MAISMGLITHIYDFKGIMKVEFGWMGILSPQVKFGGFRFFEENYYLF